MLIMGRKALRSRFSIIVLPEEDFIDQKLLSYEETCSFNNENIVSLKANVAFPSDTIFETSKNFRPKIFIL